ncbi:MAG: hypothetical protein ACXQTP_00900 [Candidatus Methanofastidiosia archaeon]
MKSKIAFVLVVLLGMLYGAFTFPTFMANLLWLVYASVAIFSLSIVATTNLDHYKHGSWNPKKTYAKEREVPQSGVPTLNLNSGK